MSTRNAVRLMQFLVAAAAGGVSIATAAECKQANEPPAPGHAPAVETGSPRGTAALDCLKYVGSIQANGVEQVLIRDDDGTIRRLRVGDSMGENGGIISRIDENSIYITQHAQRGKGGRKDVVVKFPKNAR